MCYVEALFLKFITHMLHFIDVRVCMQYMQNTRVKGPVTDMLPIAVD